MGILTAYVIRRRFYGFKIRETVDVPCVSIDLEGMSIPMCAEWSSKAFF